MRVGEEEVVRAVRKRKKGELRARRIWKEGANSRRIPEGKNETSVKLSGKRPQVFSLQLLAYAWQASC